LIPLRFCNKLTTLTAVHHEMVTPMEMPHNSIQQYTTHVASNMGDQIHKKGQKENPELLSEKRQLAGCNAARRQCSPRQLSLHDYEPYTIHMLDSNGTSNQISEVCHRMDQKKTGRSQSLHTSRLSFCSIDSNPAFNHQDDQMHVSATINLMEQTRPIT